VEAGRREDPLILLLHGFPEFWYSWRQQIPALVTAGYRVAAPDLRGYNLSEKPAVGYDLNTLSQDIYELACLLTERKVVVAGHDWGGAIAWAVAQRFPDKIEKLVISNAPPLGCLAGCSWSQWLRLYYVAWFQVPCLPELFLGWSRGWLLMRQLLQAPCFDDGDKTIEIYRDAISQPGALRCMLNYYRQIRTSVMQSQQHHGKVQCPVQVLWGIHDTYLTSEWLNSIPEVCDGPLEMVQLECGHWTQQEVPDQVTRHMLLFLGSSSKSNFSK
jgi:pimeloyl-ACP methyl ester carboxylesterase